MGTLKLPDLKLRKKQEPYKKICKHPGCTNEYYGISVSKYCNEHNNKKCCSARLKNRIQNTEKEFIIIDFKNTESLRVILQCKCCGEEYVVKVLCDNKFYPKYCEEHRSKYKRKVYASKL